MRNAYTMVELIFVIVVIGILASIALPRLAAIRYDAKAASIKSTISSAINAVPAYYTGQRKVSILDAMVIDRGIWAFSNSDCTATYTNGSGTIVMEINQNAATTPTGGCSSDVVNSSDGNLSFQVAYNTAVDSNIIDIIVNELKSEDTRIALNAKKVRR